jgi:hypothetical protein
MKLTELNPRWLGYDGEKLGLSFDCPHCKVQRLAVAFHHHGNALTDDQHILAEHPMTKIWDFIGTDFEDATLSPSIDTSASGHWHGFITNGQVT